MQKRIGSIVDKRETELSALKSIVRTVTRQALEEKQFIHLLGFYFLLFGVLLIHFMNNIDDKRKVQYYNRFLKL
ncbi:MAG: hypothetical protein WCF03_01655 [Nitrososphaeraceae archaeon]